MLFSDEYDCICVVFIMGFVSWVVFYECLSYWWVCIDWYFCQVIVDLDEDESGEVVCGSVGVEWILLWEEVLDEELVSW